jgi:NADH:ubiquinone oxidoreductase subunit 11 or 4L (chain K)
MTAAMAVPMEHALVVAGLLFCVGLFGLMLRRNIIFMLMALELMLNGAALAFIAAGARWGNADGQVMFLFILTIAAAEVSVGLGLVLQMRRQIRSLDMNDASRLRG